MKQDNYLSKEEIEKSLHYIVENSIKKQKQQVHSDNITDTLRIIGLKSLFPNWMIIIAIIGMTFILYGLAIAKSNSDIQIIRTVFAFSPLIFMATMLANDEYMKKSRMNEIELACFFNLYRLTAVRMFLISIISIVGNIIMILLAYFMNHNINVFYTVSVSNSSLFMVSLGMVAFITINKYEKLILFFPVIWIILNGLFYQTEIYEQVIINGSLVLHWFVALIAATIYLIQLKSFIQKTYNGEGKILC